MKLTLVLGLLACVATANTYAATLALTNSSFDTYIEKTTLTTDIESATKAARKTTAELSALKKAYESSDGAKKLELEEPLAKAEISNAQALVLVGQLALDLAKLEATKGWADAVEYYSFIQTVVDNHHYKKIADLAISTLHKKFDAKMKNAKIALQVALVRENIALAGEWGKSSFIEELSCKEASALECAREYKEVSIAAAKDLFTLKNTANLLKSYALAEEIRRKQPISVSTSVATLHPISSMDKKSAFKLLPPKAGIGHGSTL